MARYKVTSWLIGDSVPCRLSIKVNGTPTDADAIPTITIWDSATTKHADGVNMTQESTGEYVYYAPTIYNSTEYVVGKCYYVISYAVSTIDRRKQSMFFTYDQTTWVTIGKVRGILDNLQEGELESATIYEHYQTATRFVTREASASADADLLSDAIYAEAALKSYISYLTDRERAGDQIGTAAYIMLAELRAEATRSLELVKRYDGSKSEVQRGVFMTTESAYQLTPYKQWDPGEQTADRKNR